MGVEADDRINVFLVEAGHDNIAGLPVSHQGTAVDIGQLDILGVFHHVQTVMVRPLASHCAGVADAVPIEHLGAAPGSGKRLARLAPEMSANALDRYVPARLDPLLARHIGEPLDVVGKPDHHIDTEVAHQLDLLDRRRFDPRARRDQHRVGVMQQRLAHVMAAVDHAVPIHRMHHLTWLQPLHPVDPGQQQTLDLAALRAEQQRLRSPCGAAGRVQDHRPEMTVDRYISAREIPEWRLQRDAVHQLMLAEGGQLGDVIQTANIGRHQPFGAPQALVERDLPGSIHLLHEALVLQGTQLVPADAGMLPGEGVTDWIVSQNLAHIE